MISHLDIPRPKTWKGQPVRWVQRKFNGIRLLVRRRGDAWGWDAWTRNGKTNHIAALMMIPRIAAEIQKMPEGSVIDCELWAPDAHETDIITLINERSDRLRLTVFAIPFWNGKDLRNGDLLLTLANFLGVFNIANTLEFNADEMSEESLLAGAKAHKWEGHVLKNGHYSEWFKLKPVSTVDLVVLDYSISTSETHYGKLRALKMGTPDGTVYASVGSGFDQDWRHSVDPKTLIGKVAEIEYDSLAAQGRLKFPRFFRFRDDKSPEECVAPEDQ